MKLGSATRDRLKLSSLVAAALGAVVLAWVLALLFSLPLTTGPVDRGAAEATVERRLGPDRIERAESFRAGQRKLAIGATALDLAVLNGHFRDWDLAGIARPGGEGSAIVLPRSRARMRLVPAIADEQRAGLLRQFDVGVALRYAPGLGPAPIEMASAGMSVVTATFAEKSPAALAAISENLIPAEARVEAIAAGLAQAERRTGDVEGRVAGAAIEWPVTWDETFDDPTMEAIERLAE